MDAWPDGLAGQDAVGAHLVLGHALDGDDRPAQLLVDVDHLPERRRVRVDDVVAEDHHERLVADQAFGDEHGVAEAERLALADVREVDEVGDLADLGKQIRLAARLEKRLELDVDVEVVLDGVLASAGDEDDVVHARGDGLLDAVLDDRLVHERQHLLGLRLGGRQEARAEAGDWEDRLADAGWCHGTPLLLRVSRDRISWDPIRPRAGRARWRCRDQRLRTSSSQASAIAVSAGSRARSHAWSSRSRSSR